MFEGMNLKEWFSLAASLVGVFVIPFTLVGIWRSRVLSQEAENWKARQEEIGTYNDINNRYAEFLKILLQYADVDIGEFETPKELSSEVDIYRRNIMYSMLVSLMERAFMLYTSIDMFERELLKNKSNRTRLVYILDKVEIFMFGQHPKKYETHIF